MPDEGLPNPDDSTKVVSIPPSGGKKVKNIYVKDGKLVIEYEE